MYPSYLFGRSGGLDETTGLFVLEGGVESFDITRDTIKLVASSRDGYEIGSKIPFQDTAHQDEVNFLNKLPGYTTHVGEFGLDVEAHIVADPNGSPGILEESTESLILNHSTTKIANRRYVNEFMGVIPKSRVIKVIMRQMDIATKRIVLFGSCVDPIEGGGLWLVSPHGFPWVDSPKYILEDGTPDDLKRAIEEHNFLFLAMTGAVPFIAGHRHRQSDEESPRILRIPSYHGEYLDLLDERVGALVEGKKGVGYNHEPDLGFVRQLYGGAKKAGKVEVKSKDLLDNGAISLMDIDTLF